MLQPMKQKRARKTIKIDVVPVPSSQTATRLVTKEMLCGRMGSVYSYWVFWCRALPFTTVLAFRCQGPLSTQRVPQDSIAIAWKYTISFFVGGDTFPCYMFHYQAP